MAARLIGAGLSGSIGLLMIVLGLLLWKKQRVSILHEYHADKVSQEDLKAFCTLSGIGLLVTGISLVITAVLLGITDSPASFLCFAVGLIAGLALLITAGVKYNR